MFTEDASIFFNEFAVDVTVSGGSTFKALLDRPDEEIGQFGISTEYLLTARSSDVASLAEGTTLTIAGSSYVVRTLPRKLSDGVISTVQIDKA